MKALKLLSAMSHSNPSPLQPVSPGLFSMGCRPGFHGVCLTLALGAWLFRNPVQAWVTERAVLASDIPSVGAVEYLCSSTDDPNRIVEALWDTRRIHHRQLALRQMQRFGAANEALPEPMERILLEGAVDVDFMARETTLRQLRSRGHPALWPLVTVQLHDPDPVLRLLGLQHLKFAPPEIGLPLVIPMLDDPDLQVVATCLRWLERWTGETYGVLVAQSRKNYNPRSGREEYSPWQRAHVGAAAEAAQAWWQQHRESYPPPTLSLEDSWAPTQAPIMARDFALPDLDGRLARLSDHHGKVVVINFWASWCAPCLAEIPELVDLQRRQADRVVVLSISLDAVPDVHGHVGGHESPGEAEGGDREADLEKIRHQLNGVVRERRINYPVLLDRDNKVGGRFNAGELPTTIIVDAEGRIRRRLVGSRTLPEFEAMVAAAKK